MDVRLLGPLEVLDPDGSVREVAGHRPRAVIASLALAAPHALSSDRLIDDIWADGRASDPRAALQVAISRVRSVLGNHVLETVGSGYRLQLPVGNIDVTRFRHHVRRGRELLTLGQPMSAGESLRHALAQWRGDALVDLRRYDFAESAARVLADERMTAVELLMEAELATGNHVMVVGELSGLVEAHPLRERLWALLMLALHRSGRSSDALRAFARLRARLTDELGAEPAPELVDLEERILLHDPHLDHSLESTVSDWADDREFVGFTPGQLIVEEGSAADAVYWIEDGRVEVFKTDSDGRHQMLAELGPGRYFGELAALLGTRRTASVRALSHTTVSIHDSAGFLRRLGVERARSIGDSPPVEAMRDALHRGDYLRAFDQASAMIERGSADVDVRYHAVLALARSGATEQARHRFDVLGLGTLDPSSVPASLAEEIAALPARFDKDMALSRRGQERRRWARRSAESYAGALARHESAYLAVNSATMWLVAGDRERAALHAAGALELVDLGRRRGGGPDYWTEATEAEASLILGHLQRAGEALLRAAATGADHSSRAITIKQLRLVCALLELDAGILSPIANPSVVHYTGHRVGASPTDGRFVPDDETRVASELRAVFDRLGVGFGVGSLAAGADILAAEALLDRQADLQVVLPFGRDEFLQTSVAPAGAEWVNRFERCLGGASSVTTAVRGEYLDDPTLFDFCSRIAMGDALVRAAHLATDAHQVAVWDGLDTGAPTGTAVDVAHWATSGRDSVIIRVAGSAPPPQGPPESGKRRIRALVFADFAGYSTLTDAQLVVFQDAVMTRLAAVIERYGERVLSGRTWGDGLYLVIDDVADAADCALDLQRATDTLDVDSVGLTGLRGLRIACHAAPVFDGWDPVSGGRLYFGSGVVQTARIEPRTPEGEVFVTHPFAALTTLEAGARFDCQYVGTVPTAKGYGSVPLYSLRRRR